MEVVIADPHPYGVASESTIDAIRLLARTEGIIADSVHEGKAIRGLPDLVAAGRLRRGQRVLAGRPAAGVIPGIVLAGGAGR